MIENPEQITRLLEKLETLRKRQDQFQQEISELENEVHSLKYQAVSDEISPDLQQVQELDLQAQTQAEPELQKIVPQQQTPGPEPVKITPEKPKLRTDLEKFIGENLINKIGIAITVIGVGIGAKYAIDHQLISPWARIILGYLVGAGLFGFAFRLKKQYKDFSAVLLSGSMAIMYFITFAAYSFYDLIPLIPTFFLMVLFTIFTVAAAIVYNRQVIAHIGLVGAYAVPFLLSDGSGRVIILYGYMALINIGILSIAIHKYWKPINFSSFILTWLIFFTWYVTKYDVAEHFGLSLIFVTVFFATFYLMFLAYKSIRNEKSEIEDILLLLANSGVFYGLGYATLKSNLTGEGFLGLFTLGNALIHFGVAALIWYKKPDDRGLLSYVLGLGLVFMTIAIPVQLHGHWVTLLWSAEAAVLFWIGRTKKLSVYELLSYPLMVVVFFTLFHDWKVFYPSYDPLQPETRILLLFNIHFFTSLFVVLSFGFIQYVSRLKKYCSPLVHQTMLLEIAGIFIPAILLIIIYFSFIMEISTFWGQLFVDSMVTKNQNLTVSQHFQNTDLLKYNILSILNYSLLFFSLLSLVNLTKLKNTTLGLVNLGLNAIVIGVFLTVGLYTIGELRDSYISQNLSEFYYRGSLNIWIRYVSFLFAGLMLFSVYKYVIGDFIKMNFKMEFDFLLHISVLTILGNELINWMDLYEPGQSYKLGLSILCGVYALILVALGIWKKKTHLRIAAMVLFAATLLKLFFYDLTDLDTISKTIVFVILGVLLLIISFLYNKYKALISDGREENRDM